MTTHSFVTDFATFNTDTGAQNDAVTQLGRDKNTYHTQVMADFDKHRKQGAEVALLFFFYAVFSSLDPGNGHTMTGLEEGQLGITGHGFTSNGDFTQLSVDTQTYANDTCPDPASDQLSNLCGSLAFNSDGKINLSQSKPGLDLFLYAFDPKHGTGGSAPDPFSEDIQSCFDP